MTHEHTIDGVPKTKDEFFSDPRVIRHEAAHALYNRMQKYIYAYKQRKGIIK